MNADTTEISLDNPNSVGVPGAMDVRYETGMNDVTVAKGTTDGEMQVKPGETTLFGISSTFDNGKFPAWWVRHVKNGEKMTMDVEFYAFVREDGKTEKVALPFLSERAVFTTDVLGGGETTTKTMPRNAAVSFIPPKL